MGVFNGFKQLKTSLEKMFHPCFVVLAYRQCAAAVRSVDAECADDGMALGREGVMQRFKIGLLLFLLLKKMEYRTIMPYIKYLFG